MLPGSEMANLDLLMRSLEFIEDHLEDTVAVQTEDIAAACYASKSALEKVFKYTIRRISKSVTAKRNASTPWNCFQKSQASYN